MPRAFNGTWHSWMIVFGRRRAPRSHPAGTGDIRGRLLPEGASFPATPARGGRSMP